MKHIEGKVYRSLAAFIGKVYFYGQKTRGNVYYFMLKVKI